MQLTSPTPFADIISSLAVLHQDQHQALLDLRTDQERRFQAILQAQQEDRGRFRSWIDREVRMEATGQHAAPTHLPLNKMGPHDDPEAPQRVGWTPEQHCQRFRSLELGESGRPFVMAQQLRDSCRKWLLAEGGDVEQVIDRVVLEKLISRLPKKTAEWVQCHCPTSLDSAIHFTEDHVVACPGVGEPLPSIFLSPSLPPSSLFRPIPLPRSRLPGPPCVPPRGRAGLTRVTSPVRELTAARPDPAPASPLSPR
ncbi:uncharacterized protein LOC125266314 [Megalobrama amblycephala]|uniref:uncharacterized protein LOC125266314 n=1 Tax=Megalobrama amblycephala TaxID=75352 RepID=UPI002014452C|nr:uncharacterized protein LOC125266314 [Megalobrama amblycephala]